MHEQKIMIFTDKEQEFVDLLIKIGTRRNIAAALVFLANTPEATSREIERGTDLRQPEVSMAIKYLTEQCWITIREIPSERKGRPLKRYSLAISFKEIITAIEKEKKKEVNDQIGMIQKLRDDLAAVSG